MRETHLGWAEAACAALLLSVAAAAPVCADPVEDFYRGKQMSFVIRSGVGGTYDLYGRLLAHHMSRHIPGNPAILPINMGGGGGDKLITPLVQVGLEKEPQLPNVPLLRDLAGTEEQRQVFEFMSRAVAIGRPIATAPGVAAERVAALRAAFEATLVDPDFLADAAKERLEIRPMNGNDLAELINSVIETPISVREKVKLAIQPNNPKTLPGAKPQ